MAKEIERKFLVSSTSFLDMAIKKIVIIQGYLSVNPNATVRVRIADDEAFITVKSKNHGCSRDEWEYPIPYADALQMIQTCARGVIEKDRYIVPFAGHTWEVDCFGGRHQGLVIAEIELPSEDTQFDVPDFVAEEVTGDPRYYNSNLSRE